MCRFSFEEFFSGSTSNISPREFSRGQKPAWAKPLPSRSIQNRLASHRVVTETNDIPG
jgi:hypothetical protein